MHGRGTAAHVLGVGRAGVIAAAEALQEAGVIGDGRGRIRLPTVARWRRMPASAAT
jgi:hypothetical protein